MPGLHNVIFDSGGAALAQIHLLQLIHLSPFTTKYRGQGSTVEREFFEGACPYFSSMGCSRGKGGFAQAQHHRYQKLHCGDQAGPSSYQRSKRSAMQGPLVCRLPL